METNINYTAVGAFVIFLTACLVFSIIWLSSDIASAGEFSTYQVYMKESVSGLSQDAAVEYNGVNVGTVSNIQINLKNPQLVELLLKIKNDIPITQGTRAKLDVRSLSGVAYVALEDQGKNLTLLHAKPGQRYPVIETVPSIFVRLDIALTQLSSSFQELNTSVKSLLDDQNLHSIKQILQTSQNTLQVLHAQTLPATNQAISNLDNVTHNLSDLTAEVKKNPAILIRGKQQQTLGPGE